MPALARRLKPLACASALALLAAIAFTGTAGADPTPITAGGAAVNLVATGLQYTTALAFGDGAMFAGEGPNPTGAAGGGLFVVAGGAGTRLPDSPQSVFGLAWHDGELYVSTGPSIIVMSGWSGTAFTATRTVYRGGGGFNGFSGIAFGPDGRIYAGLLLKQPNYDHAKDPYWLSQGVVSMTTAGKHLRFIARGLRQPFQLVFPAGARWPYVTDLGQDLGSIPPDEIVHAKPGQNYGFPSCTWLVLTACEGYAKPLILLPAHTSPMGIAAIGTTLYVALYTGLPGVGSEVVSIPDSGGSPTILMGGFASSIIAIAIHGGLLYAAQEDGNIYSTTP